MRSGGSMEQPKLAKQCILPGDRLGCRNRKKIQIYLSKK
jgi:hypothetical protein